MIATWMVSLNGWVLAVIAALAFAGTVLVGLVIHDEIGLYRMRRDMRRRAARRRQNKGTR